MRRSVIAFLITGLAVASLVASTPANAKPIDRHHGNWFKDAPARSLRMLDAAGVTPADSVIDVGGGASPMTGALSNGTSGTVIP